MFIRRAKVIRSRTKKTTQKLAELGIEIPVLDILNQVPKKRPAKEEKSGEVEAPEHAKKQKLETDDSVKPKKQKLEKSGDSVKIQKADKLISGTEKDSEEKDSIPKKAPESADLSAKKKQKSKKGLESPKVISNPIQKMKNPPAPTADKVKTPKPKSVEKAAPETPVSAETKTSKASEFQTPKQDQDKVPTTTPKQVKETSKPVQAMLEQKLKTPAVTPKPITPAVTTKPKTPAVTPKHKTPAVTPKHKTPAVTPKHDAKKTPAKSPGLKSNHLDLSALFGVGLTPKSASTSKSKSATPLQKFEKVFKCLALITLMRFKFNSFKMRSFNRHNARVCHFPEFCNL